MTNKWYEFIKYKFPEQYERMQKFGRRNVSFSTIAPTGTVSIMTQTTSGIEPLFQAFYIRRKKTNSNDKNTRIDFTDDSGDTWQEFFIIHPKFKAWILLQPHKEGIILKDLKQEQLQKLFEKSPWYNSTANDIEWKKRIKMQSVLQKYISHSISSTVNLPNDVTPEAVGEIYMEAWKSGLKGITVYRDGSRSGVLVSTKKDNKFEETNAPKRPKRLPCKVLHFQNNYQKWIAFVGLVDDKPYEIFTGLAEAINIPVSTTTGFIEKVKINGITRYDLIRIQDDKEIVYHGLSNIFNKEYWNYAKLISGILRHGMPLISVIKVIENLDFHNNSIGSWKNGVERVLRKFLKTTDGKQECNNCKSTNLIYEEGCLICKDCGNSLCG
jgi:ribonucleoside-diphosphate reductase alpha chain